ncbi:hypothetical protein [Bradyrhizobium sp. 192]|uniref:hypothetical protein n=1 Tax=Bradyrhizobium sp. 192 TaxID=2782660 RepID=UPI001FFF5F07|nr:hypothetical protein [Bradyrhizobium sp. 192]UPJ59980.1 hypothetical protein IVB24_10045 [Bradyrhizobium sp. 192]
MPAPIEGLFSFFVLVALIAGGVFLFAVVAYVLNHTNIVRLAINAGLVRLGIWAIVTWPHDSGAWFIAFCAFAIGGFNLYSMLSEYTSLLRSGRIEAFDMAGLGRPATARRL